MPYFQEASIQFLDENPWMHPYDVWYGRSVIGQQFYKWDESVDDDEEGAYFYDSDSDGEDEYVCIENGEFKTETYKKEGCNKHYCEIYPDENFI